MLLGLFVLDTLVLGLARFVDTAQDRQGFLSEAEDNDQSVIVSATVDGEFLVKFMSP